MPLLSSMGLIFFFYLFKILYFILFCFSVFYSVFTVLCGTCFLLYLFFFYFIYWEKTDSKCLLTIKYSMLPCIMLKFLLQVHFIYLLISSFIHIRFLPSVNFGPVCVAKSFRTKLDIRQTSVCPKSSSVLLSTRVLSIRLHWLRVHECVCHPVFDVQVCVHVFCAILRVWELPLLCAASRRVRVPPARDCLFPPAVAATDPGAPGTELRACLSLSLSSSCRCPYRSCCGTNVPPGRTQGLPLKALPEGKSVFTQLEALWRT